MIEDAQKRHNLPASVAQRIRIVLFCRTRASVYREITEKPGTSASTISRWKQWGDADGLLALATIHPGLPPQKLTPGARQMRLQPFLMPDPAHALLAEPRGSGHMPRVPQCVALPGFSCVVFGMTPGSVFRRNRWRSASQKPLTIYCFYFHSRLPLSIFSVPREF